MCRWKRRAASSKSASKPASTSSTPPTSTRSASRKKSSARRWALAGRRSSSPPRLRPSRTRHQQGRPLPPPHHRSLRGQPAPSRHRLHRSLPVPQLRFAHAARGNPARLRRSRSASGKVRYIGCSNYSGWHLMKALAISDRLGIARYISQQINYSLLARDAEHELVPAGLDQRVGIMAWSPAAGRPAVRQVPPRRSASPPNRG